MYNMNGLDSSSMRAEELYLIMFCLYFVISVDFNDILTTKQNNFRNSHVSSSNTRKLVKSFRFIACAIHTSANWYWMDLLLSTGYKKVNVTIEIDGRNAKNWIY